MRHTWSFSTNFIDGEEAAIKVILAAHDGYVSRSDLVQIRMQHSEHLDSVISLSSWDRFILAPVIQSETPLLALLASATGALLIKQPRLSTPKVLQLLEKEMALRLSFDWILPTKPRPYRVALIGGRTIPDPQSGQHGSSGATSRPPKASAYRW